RGGRDDDFEAYEPEGSPLLSDVNERFQCCQRQRRGTVDGTLARKVPASARQTRTLTRKGRARMLGLHNPENGQEYTPCSMRSRSCSTSLAPAEVLRSSRGACPPRPD